LLSQGIRPCDVSQQTRRSETTSERREGTLRREKSLIGLDQASRENDAVRVLWSNPIERVDDLGKDCGLGIHVEYRRRHWEVPRVEGVQNERKVDAGIVANG